MSEQNSDLLGTATAFQADAVQRLSNVLREHGVAFEPFQVNVGAKRGFWTSFMLNGREHILAIYPDELNILAGPDLYESYLSHEFESKEKRIESFARRLTRLLEEGLWELPEEKAGGGRP